MSILVDQSSAFNSKLTKRETTCLCLAAEDHTLNDTASCMHVSLDTVKKYRSTILRKLGCQTMVGAVTYAIRIGILSTSN